MSDSQLEGADVNGRTAGLMEKMELLKASVKVTPVGFPSKIGWKCFVVWGLYR